MKTIGLIGGITWHSTLDYYRLLNEQVQAKLGGVHSAKIILHSVDFAEIKAPTLREDWNEIADIMCSAAKTLETAGADCLVICANTMHNIAHRVEKEISIPLIHIADATARAINEKGLKKVTLLGTKYTMQMDFYKERLAAQGISVIVPAEPDIEFINHSIYEEFGKGDISSRTKTTVFVHHRLAAATGRSGCCAGLYRNTHSHQTGGLPGTRF